MEETKQYQQNHSDDGCSDDDESTRNFKTLQDLELNLYSYIPVLKTVAERPAVENPFISKLKVTRWDKCRIILLCFLIPFRMMILGSSLIVACAIAKLFLIGYIEVEPLIPFRGLRKLGQEFMYILCRICAFSCGFHDIKIKGALSPETRIIVAAPHSSFIDIFATMLVGHHSAVTRTENVKSYFIGNCIRLMQPTEVQREAKDSKIYGIKEIKRRANTMEWPPTLIFPEGTCTNRESLIFFKPGAFYPGLPVQPMILRYKDDMDYASWTVIGRNALSLLCLMMTRLNNKMELEILPVYKPSQEEINDPFLYARNVRERVAKVDNTPVTDHSYEDCRLMLEAERLKMPIETGLVEYYKLNRLIGINCDYMMEQLHKFSKIDLNLDGFIDLDEFCDYLNLPATEEIQIIFHLYDIHKNNRISFRHFLIGQFLIAKPHCTEENIYDIFNTIFCPDQQQQQKEQCPDIGLNKCSPEQEEKTLSVDEFLDVIKIKMDVYDDCVREVFHEICNTGVGVNDGPGGGEGSVNTTSATTTTTRLDYKQFKDYCLSKPEFVLLFLHMRNTEKISVESFEGNI